MTAFIGVGANIGKPEEQVRAAVRELGALRETRLIRASSFYRTAPVGYVEQPDFVNAVAELDTALAPRELLDALLAIEQRHGRMRAFTNAPRTLDLDILLYGDREIREPGLTIPHPRVHERAFVIVPLAEIAPDALVPGQGRVCDLLASVETSSVSRLEVAPT